MIPPDVLRARLEDLLLDTADAAMRRVAHDVLDDARRDVPVVDPDEDPDPNVTLADTGKVSRERRIRGWVVSFDTPYALRQHMAPLKHPRGGHRFFLRSAVARASPKVAERIAADLRLRF